VDKKSLLGNLVRGYGDVEEKLHQLISHLVFGEKEESISKKVVLGGFLQGGVKEKSEKKKGRKKKPTRPPY